MNKKNRQIKMMDIVSIVENPANTKIHSPEQIALISQNIIRSGFNVPLQIDSANMLWAGHGRLSAARGLGLKEVPVIVLDDLDRNELLVNSLVDNRASEYGNEYNYDNLHLALDELQDSGEDISAIQFDKDFFDAAFDPANSDRRNPAAVGISSGNNEWYTPSYIIELARDCMGSIDTDPASCEIAQKTVRAGTYYSSDDDGLLHSWSGNVWMNPPYASGLIGKFIDKLIEEWQNGNIDQLIMLVDNCTDKSWYERLVSEVPDAVYAFWKGRIKFLDSDGQEGRKHGLRGSMFIYFGENKDRFRRIFDAHCLMFKYIQPLDVDSVI